MKSTRAGGTTTKPTRTLLTLLGSLVVLSSLVLLESRHLTLQEQAREQEQLVAPLVLPKLGRLQICPLHSENLVLKVELSSPILTRTNSQLWAGEQQIKFSKQLHS